MFSAVLLCAAFCAAPQDSAHLVIVATTDVHGHATAWNYLTNKPHPGGLARAAAAVDSLRRRYPGQVILVDAGDLIQGDPFAEFFAGIGARDPHPVIDAMNLMGYDAATLGNHDFDFGLDVLWRSLAGAAFPYVSANIFQDETLVFQPTTVIRRNGLRVAITGLTTPGVMVWDRRQLQGRVRVGPIGTAAPAALDRARRSADLSVVLVHSGLRGPSAYDTTGVGPENAAAQLADGPARPDLVVVGHSHSEIVDTVINGVHFIQPRPYAQTLAVAHVHMNRGPTGWRVTRILAGRIELGRVDPDRRIERRLWGDHQSVMSWVASPIGAAAKAMPARLGRAQPTAIINFINEVQRQRTGAQLSATSALNLDAGFPAGEIRLAHMAALYPYENTLRAVAITGAQLRAFLEHSVRYYQVVRGRVVINDSIRGYDYDMVLGASYQVDLRRPVGDRIRGLSIDGIPVVDSDTVTMALNSYRQAGGGGYTMLRGAPVVYDRGEGVRAVLIEAVKRRGLIDPADYSAAEWSIRPTAAAAAVLTLFEDASGEAPLDRPVLRVLGISDFEGALAPTDEVGGAAELKTILDTLAADCDCLTIRVSTGDQLQGSLLADLEYGRASVAALNQLGMDAVTIGPGDLAWSLDTLRQRMADSRYPWVMTNVFDATAGARPLWARPLVPIDAGNVRITFLGYLSPTLFPERAAGDGRALEIRGGPVALREAAGTARDRGADVVVLLAHGGGSCDGTECWREVFELAHLLDRAGIDLILTGGTASPIDTTVAGIPIVQPAGKGTAVAVADLIPATDGWRWHTAVIPVHAGTVPPDPEVVAALERYQLEADSRLDQVVARVKLPLPRRDEPSALGRVVSDGFRNALRTDVALVPHDEIRDGLPAGRVTYSDLLQVLPTRRRVVAVQLSGADLRTLIEGVVATTPPSMHLSGAVVRFDTSRPAGRRVRDLRLLDGREIRDKDQYSLAIPESLLRDDRLVRLGTLAPISGGMPDLDALEQYLRRLRQPVDPPRDRRFKPVD